MSRRHRNVKLQDWKYKTTVAQGRDGLFASIYAIRDVRWKENDYGGTMEAFVYDVPFKSRWYDKGDRWKAFSWRDDGQFSFTLEEAVREAVIGIFKDRG